MACMVLVAEFTATSNDTVAAVIEKLEAFVGATPAPAGLVWYCIASHNEHPTQIALMEEWTDAAAHRAFVAQPAFGELMTALAPLIGGSPSGNTYSVVRSGTGAGSTA